MFHIFIHLYTFLLNMEIGTLEIFRGHIINMDYLSFFNKLTNEISRLQSFRTYVQVFFVAQQSETKSEVNLH